MSSDAAEPGSVIGPRPELPPRPPVPDDRIHGDSLPEAGGGGSTSGHWPPAPTPPPRPRSRRGRRESRGRRRRWVPIVVVAGLAIIGLNRGWPSGTVEVHSALTHSVTAIEIKNDSGDVTVTTGARAGSVELTRRLPRGRASSASGAIETWNGDTLVLGSGADCASSCSTDYTVQVPEGTRVTIDTGSGDVQLTGRLGAINAKTGSGDLQLDDLASTAVTATTGSGDVDLSMVAAPDALTVKTGSGDVKAKLPDEATYAVASNTGSGDTHVGVKTSPASGHKVQVNTGSGDIEVEQR